MKTCCGSKHTTNLGKQVRLDFRKPLAKLRQSYKNIVKNVVSVTFLLDKKNLFYVIANI